MKKMKYAYRPHRGSLAEAMKHQKFFRNIDELIVIINEELKFTGKVVTQDDLLTKPCGMDDRINWETHMIYCDPNLPFPSNSELGVLGFINADISTIAAK
ncbi:hypothetical protein [Photobacterium kishitanii]|uniref:Uncharacterized protein n=1 Tax=Photobacterium kishitanii TaxID=318456 RepID=A0A2T3KLD9_9GAMM|nr:hypothetical protein [Photobacterium kishitanii]PSV00473.1 hypothetical protein C9J27_04895 [Photobacterium kishitanii]